MIMRRTRFNLTFLVAQVAATAAAGSTPIDTRAPSVVLHIDDAVGLTPILQLGGAGAAPLGTAHLSSAEPETLGCDGRINKAGMHLWNQIHYDTDFTEPSVLARTYFFSRRNGSGRFSVRASDDSGVRRVTVSVRERNVKANHGGFGLTSDGPSDFSGVVPARARSYFLPVWKGSDTAQHFSHYEKRLELEPRRADNATDAAMTFELSAFGSEARLLVTVEDNAGNISTGSAYLAPGWACDGG